MFKTSVSNYLVATRRSHSKTTLMISQLKNFAKINSTECNIQREVGTRGVVPTWRNSPGVS